MISSCLKIVMLLIYLKHLGSLISHLFTASPINPTLSPHFGAPLAFFPALPVTCRLTVYMIQKNHLFRYGEFPYISGRVFPTLLFFNVKSSRLNNLGSL